MEGCWFCLSNPNADVHLVASIGAPSLCCMLLQGLHKRHLLCSRGMAQATFRELPAKAGLTAPWLHVWHVFMMLREGDVGLYWIGACSTDTSSMCR